MCPIVCSRKHVTFALLVALLIQLPLCRQAPKLGRQQQQQQQQEAAASRPLPAVVQRPPLAATGTRSMATSTHWAATAAGALLPVLPVPGTGSRCSRALHDGPHQPTWPAAPAARCATAAAAAAALVPVAPVRQRQQAGWPVQHDARPRADSTHARLMRWLTSRGHRPQQRVMGRLVMAAAAVVRYI
jgi:hypothetical protein